MSDLIGMRSCATRSLCVAVLVVVTATNISVGQTGSAPSNEPSAGSSSGGPVALPARVGGTPPSAGLRIGYFSPALGAKFEIVNVNLNGSLMSVARLVDTPVAGSPLAGRGLVKGDMITALDSDPIQEERELEVHEKNTTVSWVANNTQAMRTFSIYIQPGKRFVDPNSSGPNTGTTGPPINMMADISGSWNCSCGGLWTLAQNGNQVTGDETDSKGTSRVVGNFVGNTFRFTYYSLNGINGSGVFTSSANNSRMSGTISWRNGTSSRPTLTRVVSSGIPGTGSNPGTTSNPGLGTSYTVVGLKNSSNQFISCKLRWNGGAWQNVNINPGQSWTYWMNGHRNRPELQINMDLTGGQDIQNMTLSGTNVTLQGNPTIRDANVYRIQSFGGQVAISN